MTKTITGIYENGIIRPFSKLPLAEHQRIELRLELSKSSVRATQAIIRIKTNIGRMLAISKDLSPLTS